MSIRMHKAAVSVALVMFATGVAESQDVTPQDLTSLIPPNAQPGECYAKVLVPAKFDTVSERVIKQEASEEIKIIPAKFEWVEERVLTKEATETLTVIPAVFRWVEERIMVEPASTRLVSVPPEYETVTERVLERPEQTVWRKGRGPIEKIDNTTGEILCLVVEPAVFKTITRTIVKRPAGTRAVDVPPVFKTLRKQVVEKPAEIRKATLPAEFSVVRVRKMIEPAREERVTIPAEFQTVTKRVKVSSEEFRWQSILCETNVNQDIIARLQQALEAKGFSPGDIDGVLGRSTLGAVEAYQRATGLARGGVTMETLESLEVELR